MAETPKISSESADSSDSAASQPVKPVKVYRVRELPPPPSEEDLGQRPLALAELLRPSRWQIAWRQGRWTLAKGERRARLRLAGGLLATVVAALALGVWWTSPAENGEDTSDATHSASDEKQTAGRPTASSPHDEAAIIEEPLLAAGGDNAELRCLADSLEGNVAPWKIIRPRHSDSFTPPRIDDGEVPAIIDPIGFGPTVKPGPGEKGHPDWLLAADTPVKGELGGRNLSGRGEGVRYGGGSSRSEKAVEQGLRWLAVHQREDGSWHFSFTTDACRHYCTHPGEEPSTTAATGMALLPFLGAAYSQVEGEYQIEIKRGLDYLATRAVRGSYGTDLRDGSMYGQALATIALCEAYGMTKDAAIQNLAQDALRFIMHAQDTQGGGWRYNPGEPGDTTVTGWMLMALKSGQMAGLQVQSPAIFRAQKFLNSVQTQDGSQYGYMSRKPRQTTTAVGLLCRMYTGWRRDNPALLLGIGHLNQWGPSETNLYYDYYATQVMFHGSGPEWEVWNRKMRDFLIGRQDRAGHASGSWHFVGDKSEVGGRLYSTAMAIMILEVYYRHLPLYREKAVSGF